MITSSVATTCSRSGLCRPGRWPGEADAEGYDGQCAHAPEADLSSAGSRSQGKSRGASVVTTQISPSCRRSRSRQERPPKMVTVPVGTDPECQGLQPAKAAQDRALMRELLKALDGSNRALRLDECGAWRITGKHGHFYTWGDGMTWLLFCDPGSPRKWTNIKKSLSPFCRVTQNGDMEGCLRLLARPTPEQAALIRRAIGLKRRKRHAGNAITLNLIRSASRRGVSAPPLSEGIVAGTSRSSGSDRSKNDAKRRASRGCGRRWSEPQKRNVAR